ncbi:MAG: serine hydrolase [Bacteroidota bacterium]
MKKKFLRLFSNQGIYKTFVATLLLAFLFSQTACEKRAPADGEVPSQTSSAAAPNRVIRNKGESHVGRLIISEPEFESDRLRPLKTALATASNSFVSQGLASSVSIYFMDLSTAEWISINGNEGYTPGSLVKVPVVMSFLKKAEQESDLMDRKLFFDPNTPPIPLQTYIVDPIKRGGSYSMRELLERIMRDSDNYSTALVNPQIDYFYFNKLYQDLNQPVPNMHDASYSTNVVDYSRFLNVLYNCTWLSERNSEMAVSWLTASLFAEGIRKHIPANVVVAHKFGEYGSGTSKQWHESGIVFQGNRPYLITIMTKGTENEKLLKVISELSKITYEYRIK